MYVFYVLKSGRTGEYYRGQAKDVERRILRHNRGESRSTKAGRPWKLVYAEQYQSRSEAVQRERFMKSAAGLREWQRFRSEIETREQQ